jgi:hypothetical protein
MKKGFIHPILFALAPILSLYANNIRELEPIAIARSLLVSILITVVLYFAIRLVTRSGHSAAILTSFMVFSFYSYGHIQRGLLQIPNAGKYIGRTVFIVPMILTILVLVIILMHLKKMNLPKVHLYINYFAVILIAIPLLQVSHFTINKALVGQNIPQNQIVDLKVKAESPDIYFIILDSYSRQDELLSRHKIDNSDFINQLKKMGFYVAGCSLSNYSFTPGSIGSTLNLDYIYNVSDESPNSRNTEILYQLVPDNKVRKSLQASGYKIVAFDTGYNWVNWTDADIYYGNSLLYLTDPFFYPFETLLIDSTALRILEKHDFFSIKTNKSIPLDSVRSHIQKTFNAINNLKATTEIESPKFVYAHIMVPHPPLVFNPDGSANWKNYYDANTGTIKQDVNMNEGFSNNVKFISIQTLDIVSGIINNSTKKPIIIVQGDHAWSQANRFPILNAYYFPDGNYKNLYPSISPVNSFRVIFNLYFGTDLPLHDDLSIKTDINQPYSRSIAEGENQICQ